MKSIIASGILLGMAHGMVAPAFAGPYANVESNTGAFGDDFQVNVVEAHVGWEEDISETTSYYVQAGPAFTFRDGEEATTDFSGKLGISTDINENVEVYGEYAFITGEELTSAVKTGVTYRF